MLHVRRALSAVALLTCVSSVASAQLPTVQQVFDKYATAVGGRDAWAKVTEVAEKGTADITFAGMTASYERYKSAPNKFRMIIDLGMGKVEQGTDGAVVWTVQPDGSMARMADDDAAYVLDGSVTGNAFLDPARYAKAAVVGQEDFDGVPCYKVALTTKTGRERTDFFEVATGFRRGQILMTPGGEQRATYREYKEFDGKKVTTRVTQSNPQGDIIINIASVTFGANDPKLFELPAGIAK